MDVVEEIPAQILRYCLYSEVQLFSSFAGCRFGISPQASICLKLRSDPFEVLNFLRKAFPFANYLIKKLNELIEMFVHR